MAALSSNKQEGFLTSEGQTRDGQLLAIENYEIVGLKGVEKMGTGTWNTQLLFILAD
ncbi:hypothetical protein WN51_02408 [Melipona quadrifasciata]|uniref:Uncharacterized protein n=1 Tax=Melipona quadrifasciata TaxID=166423 RepID=A0A0M8ZV16_9HYME|nr:hypothetical protein WN51_02408 [Melipona quadrifasciata]